MSATTAIERARGVLPDAAAAATVLFLAVPQGLAYATIAGLPPAMGLYAAALPAIVGSLFRSSRHVVVGPTNALSLLVGGAVIATSSAAPAEVAIALALGVGLFQLVATLLRLSSVVDYISSPIVLGYITGAALLIGVGQLHNMTGTEGPRGKLWVTVGGWAEGLSAASPIAVAVALGTVVAVLGLRKLSRKLPAAILVMSGGIVLNLLLGLESRGLGVVADLSPVPSGLPPLTLPSLELTVELLPVALACTVLSLVESNAVARSIASRTGQRLDARREFLGQGLANVAAAVTAGYPVSGSLSRSVLNEKAGARSKLAGVLTGVMMIGLLVSVGPVLDHTPIASLAGLLLVVAWDLVDFPKIRATLKTSRADAVAFGVTMLGTWALALDQAIYLGVGISIVLFLRKARLLVIRELVINESGHLQEHPIGGPLGPLRHCDVIRIVHVEGSLFFGSAGELRRALDDVAADPAVKVVIVRVKRARSLDVTAAEVLASTANNLREQGRHMLLVGMREDMLPVLERSGAGEAIGVENLFPTRARWFEALDAARHRALELTRGVHEHSCALSHAPSFALSDQQAA